MSQNRRQFDRFALAPMYTPVTVRRLDNSAMCLEGHAYNLSRGGIQFELDLPIEPGTPVAVQIELPAANRAEARVGGDGERTISAFGNVVWLDESEPGPARMAVAISRFACPTDQDRLLGQLSSGRFARAA